jgi:hypothetical protein
MKKTLFLLAFIFSNYCFAQESVAYLNEVSTLQENISKKYLTYTSSVSHGKSARKVEKNRMELLQTVNMSKAKATNMHAFKGDLSLKEALKNYFGILYNVLNEDYAKIVNMEEVSEQSYDGMEALFLAEELAGKKADEAFEKYRTAYNTFAKKNEIQLLEKKSELSEKLAKADQVNVYYHKMYLVFFKPFKQEVYLIDAQNRKNISSIEQNRNTLDKNAKQAVAMLDTSKAFANDRSLIVAARDLMMFYIDEASKTKTVTDFYLKSENFDKASKAFNAKSPKARTQADVDTYNKQVNELNAAMGTFNSLSEEMNKKRDIFLEKWNKATVKFLDYHMPKY